MQSCLPLGQTHSSIIQGKALRTSTDGHFSHPSICANRMQHIQTVALGLAGRQPSRKHLFINPLSLLFSDQIVIWAEWPKREKYMLFTHERFLFLCALHVSRLACSTPPCFGTEKHKTNEVRSSIYNSDSTLWKKVPFFLSTLGYNKVRFFHQENLRLEKNSRGIWIIHQKNFSQRGYSTILLY